MREEKKGRRVPHWSLGKKKMPGANRGSKRRRRHSQTRSPQKGMVTRQMMRLNTSLEITDSDSECISNFP